MLLTVLNERFARMEIERLTAKAEKLRQGPLSEAEDETDRLLRERALKYLEAGEHLIERDRRA
jgi:hypothetical protein